MFEIGNTLREARLRRGLDILQCEAETKIRAKYLRAMEGEHFDLMPSPTYVRGFLRTYADFLDLDGQLVLDEYESRFGIFEVDPRGAESEPWRRGSADSGGGMAGGAASGTRAGTGRPSPARSHRPPKRRRSTELRLLWLAIGGVMGVALLVWMGVGSTSDQVAPLPGASAVAGQEQSARVVDPDRPEQEAPARSPSVNIVLSGVGDIGSWVSVRAGDAEGRVVFEEVLGPGSTRSFRVRNPIHITTGNSAGLDVTIDGEPVDLEGATGRWLLSRNGADGVE
ncbi:MAG: DUF4115 domain-containing protein [Miltoncostaeaceae bacterium]